MSRGGWIGVDLDGTVAQYDIWRGPLHIGEPVVPMVERVKRWLAAGIEVRIFTARVAPTDDDRDLDLVRSAIETWCEQHIGQKLAVTCIKDHGMVELWDDRAVHVMPNKGLRGLGGTFD